MRTKFMSKDDNVNYMPTHLRVEINGEYITKTKAASTIGVTASWFDTMYLKHSDTENEVRLKFKEKEISIKLVGNYETVEEDDFLY